jgi:hypothetical protein
MMTAAQAIARVMYEQASRQRPQEQPGSPGAAPGDQPKGKGGDDVVDADFEVVDDDKKK